MKLNIYWFRRDLRLEDNAGLYHALKAGTAIQCIFIFDKDILDKLPEDDARVSFIHQELERLNLELNEFGSSLKTYYGKPKSVWKKILEEHEVGSVYCNRDYEPYAKKRDGEIEKVLSKDGIHLHKYKDHVIFDGEEVRKADNLPYTVFTPYKRKWLAKLETKIKGKDSYFLSSYPSLKYADAFHKHQNGNVISLKEMGFMNSELHIPSRTVKRSVIKKYDQQRDFPAIDGTSRLGIHFRFGTISIREKARHALGINAVYLSELVWRDFYSQILDYFPHVIEGPFREKYKSIEWRADEDDYKAWKEGKTGYPMVDAGMRELNATGHMHNRVRMVVASFLTKHLLLPWGWGEVYFAEKLLDFDLASNNGGWQWASGTGTDAAPYFRIFNPTSQLAKFDKDYHYVKKWVPEFGTDTYPEPIVEHKFARERCLARYKEGLA